MKKSQKIAEAVNASMYPYPYQNLLLADMPGEIWKPMPDYEGYYMVSNKGRIKSLPREKSQFLRGTFRHYTKRERIKKQTVCKNFNSYAQEYKYALSFRTSINRIEVTYRVARTVYKTFVGPVPDKMVILNKNGDPFDNSPENLYPASRKEVSREIYEKNKEVINKIQGIPSEIAVSQYDLEGNYIKTYKSLARAAEAIGVISTSTITEAMKNSRRISAGGYYWREGENKNPLDVSLIKDRIKQLKREASLNHSKKIVQYDLAGKYITTYNSAREASERTGLSINVIRNGLYGKRSSVHKFIWKHADSFDVIPNKIEVEEISK